MSVATTAPPAARRVVPVFNARNAWVAKRLGFGVLVLFAISVIVFWATQSLPGDAATAVLGQGATPERVASLRESLNLDQSIVSQYGHWLSGAVTLDFGESLTAGGSVSSLVGDRIVNSIALVAIAATVTIPLAVLLGAYSAVRRDTRIDRVLFGAILVLPAIPDFVIAVGLVILFATTVLTVLPAVVLPAPGASPLTDPTALILPVTVLVLGSFPHVFRQVRGAMIDILESEYVQTARLNGLSERTVIFRHALPNAWVAMIQVSSLLFAYMLGGVVIVEFLFKYPGLGSALTEAIAARDVPVIQAIVLISATAIVLLNLLADVLTVYVTPRLRTARS